MMDIDMIFCADRLHSSLSALGVDPKDDLFTQLATAYGETGRFYHDATHVAHCLTEFSHYQNQAQHPAEIEIAFWFHDAIYDTHRKDNELRSADWSSDYLKSKGVATISCDRIHAMILATQTHETNDGDAALMLDIDLGILGASPPAFEQYDQAIRREYAWVPFAQYKIGRAQVLQQFLQRPRIYQTEQLADRLEAQARENLMRKIADLTAT